LLGEEGRQIDLFAFVEAQGEIVCGELPIRRAGRSRHEDELRLLVQPEREGLEAARAGPFEAPDDLSREEEIVAGAIVGRVDRQGREQAEIADVAAGEPPVDPLGRLREDPALHLVGDLIDPDLHGNRLVLD